MFDFVKFQVQNLTFSFDLSIILNYNNIETWVRILEINHLQIQDLDSGSNGEILNSLTFDVSCEKVKFALKYVKDGLFVWSNNLYICYSFQILSLKI